MEKPKVKEEIDLTNLIKTCQNILNNIESGQYHEDDCLDNRYYVYTEAMKAIFGDNVSDYINSKN